MDGRRVSRQLLEPLPLRALCGQEPDEARVRAQRVEVRVPFETWIAREPPVRGGLQPVETTEDTVGAVIPVGAQTRVNLTLGTSRQRARVAAASVTSWSRTGASSLSTSATSAERPSPRTGSSRSRSVWT
jgi:hypothetical protein